MKLLTIEETSQFLNIKIGTLYVWVHYKKIPFVKIGRRLAFNEAQLIEYINSNTFMPEWLKKVLKSKSLCYSVMVNEKGT